MTHLLRTQVYFLVLLIACAASGCGGHMPRKSCDTYVEPSSVRRGTTIKVGAAQRDITPPAGSSLAGHGPGGRVAMGHWTRLFCRAFYIEPARSHVAGKQSPLALVSCDLPYMSTLLVRRTLEILDEKVKSKSASESITHLDATRLMMAGTHTHAGPAHYFDVSSLSSFASSQFPGHDAQMVTFLAENIAEALLDAYETKKDAQVRWSQSTVFSFSRNSALRQFLLNDVSTLDLPKCNDKTQLSANATCDRLSPEERNIDPRLRLVEFRDLDDTPIGGIGFYALHPTFIGNRNRHYGGDIFGIVTRNVEQELRREVARECQVKPAPNCQARRPVFALFNTNHADAQPRRIEGTEAEVIRNGNLLTEAVWKTHCSGEKPSQLCRDNPEFQADPVEHDDISTPGAPINDSDAGAPTQAPALATGAVEQTGIIVEAADPEASKWVKDPIINSRYVDVHLPGETVLSPTTGASATLTKKGELGIASTKGTLSNPSAMLFLTPQTIETFKYNERRKHTLKGPKRAMPFADGVVQTVPFSVVQLGNTVISFVPGEITLAVGHRINSAVLASARQGHPQLVKDAVIVGLANGYMNYVTTREEYELQAYHGASTVYGRQSAHFLIYTFECLARYLTLDAQKCAVSGSIGKATDFRYRVGARRQRYWLQSKDKTPTLDAGALSDTHACRLENGEAPTYCVWWRDEGPHAVSKRPWLVRLQIKSRETGKYETLRVKTSPFQGPSGKRALDDLIRSPVDDLGSAFLVQVLMRKHDAWHWSALFSSTTEVWEQIKDEDIRMEINRGSGASYSPRLDSISACSAQQINEYCTTDP